ncbi:MAG: BACON domain-containing protein [Clostridium sp.]|nr:BACON domain-containing protein [Bacteroides sp.]MCM1198259.1 BACON domain-containing protein [Clostridium sp.]
MKLRNLLFGVLASAAVLFGCEKTPQSNELKLDLSASEISFESVAQTQSITLTATRDWKVKDADKLPEWIAIDPVSGGAASNGTAVEVSVTANPGTNREASVVFTIGTLNASLKVSQKGEGGAAEDLIVYHNDFDKAKSEKGEGWNKHTLDVDENWKNETGSGISTVEYSFSGMTVRSGSGLADSSNDGNDNSLYAGSGVNNIFFAANNYFQVKNITLDPSVKNYVLSFGAIRSVYQAAAGASIFDASQFSVYVSNDGAKWVKLDYTFASGSAPDAKWDKLSSVFTLPDNTSKLYLYFTTTEASTYRIDDLDLSISSAAGTAIDFSKGVELNGGSTGGEVVGTPEGDGTEASPYNVAGAYAATVALAADVYSEEVYIKGIISTVSSVDTGTYGNAEYYISDDGTTAGQFYVYRGYYLNGDKFTAADQIKVGDNVVVYGQLINFRGNTPEVGTGSKIVSLNGSTSDDSKRLSVSTTSLNVSAEAESATFNVSGNVAWTATVTEGSDWCKILYGESGNGADAVVLELTKNESEESARTAKITVSTTEDAAVKSYVVVLTQAKKSSGEAGDGTAITWTLGTNAYDNSSTGNNQQLATINGESRTDLLKLGTSKAAGKATLKIPAGTKKVGFYGVCWKGKTASVKCSVGGTDIATQALAANEGATGNAPYTMTVTESDYYEITVPIELTSDTDVTIESVQGNDYRAILFGIVAYK